MEHLVGTVYRSNCKLCIQSGILHTLQGEWLHVFEEPLPRAVSNEQLKVNNTNFTIEEVKDWVERHGSVNGRFLFFETFVPNNEFYQKVAKPLLSMRTVGSMDVERRIKPIKQDILTKKRNRLYDGNGVALYRASENLKHIMKAKLALGKQITDSLY